jgi:hypothetical protein
LQPSIKRLFMTRIRPVHPEDRAVLGDDLDGGDWHAGITRGMDRAHYIVAFEQIYRASAHVESPIAPACIGGVRIPGTPPSLFSNVLLVT